jgi:vacuolar-type H+-ATPase subunit I/STV1
VADTDTTESQEDTATEDAGPDAGGNPPANSNGASEVDQATEKHLADLRKENASWRTKLRKAESELGKLKESTASDIDKARAEARQEALAEATAEANRRILRAEVIAAAGKLQDPSDALGHLDLDKYEVDEKGDVDRKAIAADIDELLKAKPYLGKTRAPDFGGRPTATGGRSMNDLIKQRLQRR